MRIPDALSARLPGRLGESAGTDVVSMVRLHGVISAQPSPVPRSVISSASMDKVLERAFAPERLSAVALLINSPGGSATQSALVADRIRSLAAERSVPVLAFCEDVAASGGYWLACAADEIYAHPTSLVGSIGVISQGFGLEGLIERLGVERRLHTAGRSKARLDPFLPEKPEDVTWLRGLQDQLHEQFTGWVTERRGNKLATGTELFDGEVWTGARALELGLIDGLGTPREVLSRRFPDADQRPVESRKPLLARLGMGGPAASLPGSGDPGGWVLDALSAVETRAAWARFGL
ncbi:S49 family peptidase [Pseudonocardia sediminis]|uniref:S49 family peptidase n=1 Tax=Pseudonocardia sediminis TaxID=1397368 RepID=UPI0013EF2441|nr:S49 family peptidase [Pseudonocardia sediminis]